MTNQTKGEDNEQSLSPRAQPFEACHSCDLHSGCNVLHQKLIAGMPLEDMKFLMPMALATLCSAGVLGWYVQTYRSRSRK